MVESLILFSVLSKTSLMDPRFAPAWVAFGHTFALEGEHDHAVTAYSTCARMFAGYAVPQFVERHRFTLAQVPFTPHVRGHGAYHVIQSCSR